MTAQATDLFLLDDVRYSLVGQRGSGLFVPGEHGIPTRMMHTACYRGYIATYSITDALRLDEVQLQMAEADPDRALFGVRPASYDRGRATYRALAHVVEYTGGLLLADGFIQELYVHMGFHPPHKWRVVHELIFERGRVVERHDRSADRGDVQPRLLTARDRAERPNHAMPSGFADARSPLAEAMAFAAKDNVPENFRVLDDVLLGQIEYGLGHRRTRHARDVLDQVQGQPKARRQIAGFLATHR